MTPLLSHRECEAKVGDINGFLGLSLDPATICRLCDKMQLGPAVHLPETDSVRVHVPPTRSDVLHAVDVIEDVGIAYGFNNVPISLPKTVCTGAPLPVNQFSDLLRIELANAGFMEMLTHGLCSTAENFTHLQHKVGPAVSLSNPANVEYEVVRTTLIPGALKTLAYNESLSHKNGIRLFEISDVVIPCNNDVGARNERHVVALVSALTSEFEIIHGIADRIMTCVQIQPEDRYGSTSLTSEELSDRKRVARSGVVYFVTNSTDECYFQGMRAEVVVRWDDSRGEQVVGTMGVVHPSVLDNFGITYPCSMIEINLELLM
jgi:phenylalanyl-tRNA synthetase beta chain